MPTRHVSFASALYYQDPKAALAFLEKAFGFETVMLITDPDGALAHSEMRYGDGLLMIGTEWSADRQSPRSLGGKTTQNVHVQLGEDIDIDAHCARARAAGAVIEADPEDQFYGDRTYRAKDPEGHVWTFGQTRRFVSREEAEQASGLKIEGWIEEPAS
jgi:uncharacterized glyoxalase superfamily protein PhnB